MIIQNEQRVTSYYKNKLKQLYGVATTDATSESEVLRKALKMIYEIKELKNQRSLADRPKPVRCYLNLFCYAGFQLVFDIALIAKCCYCVTKMLGAPTRRPHVNVTTIGCHLAPLDWNPR